jgi:hypothetical protein
MTAEGRGRIAESKTAESEANGKADFCRFAFFSVCCGDC